MSKETEELILIGVGLLLFFKLLGTSSTSSAAVLAQSKIDSATNLGYAADATDVIGDFTDMW